VRNNTSVIQCKLLIGGDKLILEQVLQIIHDAYFSSDASVYIVMQTGTVI